MERKSRSLMLGIAGLLAGLFLSAPSHAQLIPQNPLVGSDAPLFCPSSAEQGDWFNIDPNTRGIVAARVRAACENNPQNGQPLVDFREFISLVGACTPRDCLWGEREAFRHSDPTWLRTTYYHGYATRYVWVKLYEFYGRDYLRVYVWTDFHDGRTDYAMDDWYRKN